MPTGERSWRLNHSEDEPCKEHGKQRIELDPAVRTTWAGFSVGGAAAPSF
jgi:hypothetical protein